MSETPADKSDETVAAGPDARAARLEAAAERALREAEGRRAADAQEAPPVELGGRDGPEPVRYGDWESKGIACDF